VYNPAKQVILWAAANHTLGTHLPRYRFVQATVRRFMPGTDAEAALEAAEDLRDRGIPTTFTHLGENIEDREQAGRVAAGYLDVLDAIADRGLDTEVSVKLTHLGYDLDPEVSFGHLVAIAERAERQGNRVWVDMESSPYVSGTLAVYRRALERFPTLGVCLQAYLRRTPQDTADVLAAGGSIRLVKGAYREATDVALRSRDTIDESYRRLAMEMLRRSAGGDARITFGTHDVDLLNDIRAQAAAEGFGAEAFEVAMLYGIRVTDQYRMADEGLRVRVLIAYGTHWYPWFMRRMAERPANVWFAIRNLVARHPD
jgi:proline dehydrogenase